MSACATTAGSAQSPDVRTTPSPGVRTTPNPDVRTARPPTTGRLGIRAVRASVVGALVVGLAAIAHGTAGGALPGPVGLMLLAGIAAGLAVPLLGRPGSVPRLVGLVVGGQTLLHAVFTATGGHGEAIVHVHAPGAATGVAAVPGTLADSFDLAGLAGALPERRPFADAVAHLAADLTPAALPMLAAHLLAAAAVGLWLALGERRTAAVLRLLATRLRVLPDFRLCAAGETSRSAVPTSGPRPLAPWAGLTNVRRRGPPAATATSYP
ncbi:MAG: hypothetical protein EPO13_04910 [Actinomycetota bacterium]|nr:MAG: hypothetical protein EPO13_04910 [Actinomycetota bacterium]